MRAFRARSEGRQDDCSRTYTFHIELIFQEILQCGELTVLSNKSQQRKMDYMYESAFRRGGEYGNNLAIIEKYISKFAG
jgi:hypothetical protein